MKRKKGQKLECVFIWRDKLWRSRRPHSRSGASDPPRREEEGDTEAPHPREGDQVRSLQLRHLAFHQQPGPVRAWGAPSLDLQLSSPSSLRPSLSPRPSLRWALGPSRPPKTPVCPPGQELTGRVVVRPGVLLDSPQTLPTSRASQPTFHVPAPAPLRGRPPGPDPPRPQGRLWPPPRFSGRACTGPAWYGRPLGPGRSRVRWWGARDGLGTLPWGRGVCSRKATDGSRSIRCFGAGGCLCSAVARSSEGKHGGVRPAKFEASGVRSENRTCYLG